MLSPHTFGTQIATLGAFHSSSQGAQELGKQIFIGEKEGQKIKHYKTGAHVCCYQVLSCYVTFSFLPTTAFS